MGSHEKETIFGAARKIFGPSYFVTALAILEKVSKMMTSFIKI